MFRTRTVIVLGAGTSVDFDFPTGRDLLAGIRKELNFEYDAGRLTSGDEIAFRSMQAVVGESAGISSRTNDAFLAARRLVAATENAVSIDNAIDTLEDHLVEFVGKIGIARLILKSESAFLKKSFSNQKFNFHSIKDSWIAQFMTLLTSDRRRSQIVSCFDNVTIINFNYDRVLELVLPQALSAHFSVSVQDARDAFKRMQVYRPYGNLGRLGWQQSDLPEVEFGDSQISSIINASLSLKTFTEQIADVALVEAMHHSMSCASRIVFLGFGFHRQNLKLLSHRRSQNSELIGTSYKIPPVEVDVIEKDLRKNFTDVGSIVERVNLHNRKCAEFLSEHGRFLTS